MTTGTKITGRCEICNGEICPADTQAQFNRNYGVHKKKIHGIAGARSIYRKTTGETPKKPTTAKLRRIRRLQQIEYRRKKKQLELLEQMQNGVPSVPKTSNAEPCRLDACPACGSRFYIVKGQQ